VVTNFDSLATTFGGQVSILLGYGEGTFQLPIFFNNSKNRTAVVISDFNGDGKPDLGVTDGTSGNVSVVLSTGAEAFGARVQLAAGSYPNSVAIADINRDGNTMSTSGPSPGNPWEVSMSSLHRAVLLFIVAVVALARAPGVGAQGSATTDVQASVHKPPMDPSLSYSTYLSLTATSVPAAAWDNTGNSCVAFNTTLIKLRNDGSLVYSNSSFAGPQVGYSAAAVAIDSQGSCYVAGIGPITPTAGAFQASAPSKEFIMKFDAAGAAVTYATYLGGSGGDTPTALAVDSFGNAYLTGFTSSNDFPTSHAFQPAFGGGNSDAFIAVLNPTGSALVYSTYLGGGKQDKASSVAVDGAGNTVVTGNTDSADFPTKAALQPSLAGACCNAFVAKLDPAGNVVYSTFLGAGGAGVAVDSTGNAYLTGSGASITKVNPSGSALLYSTSLGFETFGNSIAVDSAGQAYIAGLLLSGSSPATLPLVSPIQSNYSIDGGFVSVLDASGASLLFSTFLGGGTSLHDATSVGVDSVGNIYVAGESQGGFPIVNAVNGTFEPFAAFPGQPIAFKIAPVSGPVLASPATVDFQRQPTPVGTSTNIVPVLVANAASTGTITINGITVAGDYSQTNNCPQTLLAATNCVLNVTFTPTGGGTRTGTITIADNAPGNPHVINLIGIGLVPQVSLAPTALSFASQVIATTSTPQIITLTDTGGASLTISQVSMSGDFAETNNCGTSVAASGSCQIAVTFTPTAGGSRSGTLTVVDSASGSPHTVSLSGTGANPGLGLAVPSGGTSSATISAGQSASYTLSIGGAGISGTALLSCTGAPKGASCLVPASQSVSSTAASTLNVTVTTTSRTLGALRSPASGRSTWWWALVLLGVVVMQGRGKPRTSPSRFAWLVLLLFLGSCGGGGPNPNGTPAGNYTLIVTATSGSVTEKVSLALAVQ
jgi:hypothetical protein